MWPVSLTAETTVKHIPKIIHISWKDPDILESQSVFVRNCIGRLIELAPDWKPEISDDHDIDLYLRNNLSSSDWSMLESCHIVEKTDVWRLLKMFNEGGLYTDIDRLCNTSINDVIGENTRMLLPECADTDFSQDFMCSAPGNPVFAQALAINLDRRRAGMRNVYLLGPQTYFHAITLCLTGEMIQPQPDSEVFEKLREMIAQSGFIETYREHPPYETIVYRPENPQVDFDHETEKRRFYAESGIQHWTGDW